MRPTDRALIGLGALSVIGWLILARWYSLFEHYATPGFAFDKIPGHFRSPILQGTALLFAALAVVYAAGYWLISRAAAISSLTKLMIGLTIVASGLVNIVIYPAGAIDLFVYLMELKLAYYYQQNPYLVTAFPRYMDDPFSKVASYHQSPLVYGPAWLLLSGWPAALAGFSDLLRAALAMKAFSLLLLLLASLIIYLYHRDAKSRWLAVYLFGANPLVLYLSVGQAHNDLLLTVLLLAAMLALQGRSPAAAPLLTLSALVKFFTLPLGAVFVVAMFRRGWSRTSLVWSGLLALAAAVFVTAPFWAGGKMAGGMLRALDISQNLDTVSLYALARAYLRGRYASAGALAAAQASFISLFATSTLWVLWNVRRVERALLYVLCLFYLLVSSLHPWYLIPVVGILALQHTRRDTPYLFLASALGLLFFPLDVWARFDSGFSRLGVQFFLALFLTLPMLLLLAREVYDIAST